MNKTKESSSDKIHLVFTFKLEGQNTYGFLIRLLGVFAATVGLAAKIWFLTQGSAR